MSKRHKHVNYGHKRPVDKQLIVVNFSAVGAAQVSNTLFTFGQAVTIVGLRWEFGIVQDAGVGTSRHSWVIVIVRDGDTLRTINAANNTQMYSPEQAVMVFGGSRGVDNDSKQHYSGSTKTGRKVQIGDSIIWAMIGEATDTSSVNGAIQFFLRL